MQLNRQLFVQALGEFCATAIMMQLHCMGQTPVADANAGALGWGWNTGMSVMIVMHIFGQISGGHINPCITVAAVIMQQIKWDIALVYVVCQFTGAIVGLVFGYYITPAYEFGLVYCTTEPAYEITTVGALLFEFCMTATWVMAQCAAWDPRTTESQGALTLRIGFVVVVLTLSTGYFTGASMNPARSFAGALFNLSFEPVWIYIFAPLTAAVLASFTHKYLLNDGGKANEDAA